MAASPILCCHDGSECYFIGTPADLASGDVDDVSGFEHHIKEAALQGIINISPTLDGLAKSGSEHGEQRALFAWMNYCARWYPELDFAFAVPNGGSRGDTEKSRKIAGGMMKAEGVKPGAPDVVCPWPRRHVGNNCMYAGLYIEMKTFNGGDGGSKEQHRYIDYLNSVGYAAQICNGWKEAVAAIRKYLEI